MAEEKCTSRALMSSDSVLPDWAAKMMLLYLSSGFTYRFRLFAEYVA